jgi:outer membrane protein assembly factor BamD (BamD/ComL family)
VLQHEEPPRAPPRRVAVAAPARAPSPPPVPRELELLTPAQAALRANQLDRALELADRHAALYATGTFAEEREAIAIEALQRLGQRDRARSRLAAFTTRYPQSGYRTRLERAVLE